MASTDPSGASNRRRLIAIASVVILLLIVWLFPRSAEEPDSQPGLVSGLQTPVPATGEGSEHVHDDIEVDESLRFPQEPDDPLSGFDELPAVDDDIAPVPVDTVGALDFATAYYTLAPTVPMAEHRASLRPWVTDTQFERLTSDPDGRFAEADAVRMAFGDTYSAQVAEHSLISQDGGTAEVLVIVEVLVTANGTERQDVHSMVMTMVEPQTSQGRWLIDELVIDPTVDQPDGVDPQGSAQPGQNDAGEA